MRRAVAWITPGFAVVLLAGAGAVEAQVPIRIDDARVVEQSTGSNWVLTVQVRLPGPAPAVITVDWATLSGSASAGSDFQSANGTVVFNLGDTQKPITVQINGDLSNEWTATQQDEAFFIQLSNPSANAFIEKGRGTVTLIDDDRPMPGVQFLTAVSGGTITAGVNKLQWRIPGSQTPVTDVAIVWKQGAGCTFPLSTTDTAGGGSLNTGSAAAPGAVQLFTHNGLPLGIPFCYSVFAIYSGTPTTEIAHVKATPFDTAGAVKWSYSSGSTVVVPPTVGADGIYTVDNQGVVHAMKRGPGGGLWPSTWNPLSLGKPTQNRSAVVPFASGSRLLLGTDGGGVHAIDGLSGSVIWSRSTAFAVSGSGPLPSQGGVQAQPAGLFKGFGGLNDLLLVGTNNASNQFFALNPETGADIASYLNGSMGAVNGMAVVDYGLNRVYFGTSSTSATLFALDLGPGGAPNLTLSVLGWNPKPMGSGTTGAPVLRNGTVYLGDSSGLIHALHVADGVSYNNTTSDGPVKGFLWPDRRDDRLYFATTSKVQAARDNGSSLMPIWQLPVSSPSMVLQWPGTNYLYVGDGLGRLVQIDVSDQSSKSITLESGSQIGAPSFDRQSAGQEMVIVGSASGTIYAVHVPLP